MWCTHHRNSTRPSTIIWWQRFGTRRTGWELRWTGDGSTTSHGWWSYWIQITDTCITKACKQTSWISNINCTNCNGSSLLGNVVTYRYSFFVRMPHFCRLWIWHILCLVCSNFCTIKLSIKHQLYPKSTIIYVIEKNMHVWRVTSIKNMHVPQPYLLDYCIATYHNKN